LGKSRLKWAEASDANAASAVIVVLILMFVWGFFELERYEVLIVRLIDLKKK
jgi:hypothetical protein